MRGLTLWQPYASAIINGPKRIENRKWGTPRLVGVTLAIHAALRRWNPTMMELLQMRKLWPGCPDPERLETGTILGTARIKAVCGPEDEHAKGSPWATGPVCWVLDKVSPLASPVPCKGNRGLWKIPAEIHSQIVKPTPKTGLCQCGEKQADVMIQSPGGLSFACTDCAGITAPLPGHVRVSCNRNLSSDGTHS